LFQKCEDIALEYSAVFAGTRNLRGIELVFSDQSPDGWGESVERRGGIRGRFWGFDCFRWWWSVGVCN